MPYRATLPVRSKRGAVHDVPAFRKIEDIDLTVMIHMQIAV